MSFPSVDAYIERLPGGTDAHPECQTKASVYRSSLADLPLHNINKLPPIVQELIYHPPPVTAWVSEVQALCILLAVRDQHFSPDASGLVAYEEWVRRRNRQFLAQPLYRALFLVLSPEALLSGATRRWGALHRGTAFDVLKREKGMAELHMQYPPYVLSGIILLGIRGAFCAALDMAGARSLRMEIQEVSPTEAIFSARWK